MPKLYLLLLLTLASQGMGLTRKKRGSEVYARVEDTNHEFPIGSYRLGPGYSEKKNFLNANLDKNSEGYSGIGHFDQYSFHEGNFEDNRNDRTESRIGNKQQSTSISVTTGAKKLKHEAISDDTVGKINYEGHVGFSDLRNAKGKIGGQETFDTHSIGDRGSYAFFAIGDSHIDVKGEPNSYNTGVSEQEVHGDESSGGDGKLQHYKQINYNSFGVGDEDVVDGSDYSKSEPGEFSVLKFENHGSHDKSIGKFNGGKHDGISGSSSDKGHVFSDNLLQYHQSHEPQVHEVTKVIPIHKTIKIPKPHQVQKLLNIPVPFKVLEPYHIKIPVPISVEKIVQVPVEKIVKYSVIKPVPVKVEKKIRVPVFKPFPVPVPVYKLKLVIHSQDSERVK